jgi:N-acetylglucosaminyldiphosphoundecaprenol N-acetyl-beta-D-mannosaminyltransferase
MASMATDASRTGFTGPADPPSWTVTSVLGVQVAVSGNVFAAALELKQRGGGQIVTLNAEMTMAARANPELGAAIAQAGLVIPDGAGVVWALGRQGYRVPRSPGIELARQLLVYAAAHQWRVALVGGSPEVMERLVERLQSEIPTLDLAFAIHGYQAPDQWPGIEQQLREARPDLVLAALGVPRQETWIQRLHAGQPGLWMGVGGSFDVWSGAKERAPEWMGRFQIEWLYRLIQEPSRWRRMLALPAFAWAVLRRG